MHGAISAHIQYDRDDHMDVGGGAVDGGAVDGGDYINGCGEDGSDQNNKLANLKRYVSRVLISA